MRKYIFVLFAVFASSLMAKKGNYQTGDYGYLFCHMNDRGRAWTAYALSRDGLHYHDLLGGDSIFSDWEHARIEGATRDAYICRKHDGSGYLMACTDMNVGRFKDLKKQAEWDNYGICLLRSDDLMHWESKSFDFRKGLDIFCNPEAESVYRDWATINRVWAPQIMWDEDYIWPDGKRGGYFVYYSMWNRAEEKYDRMYYSYADESFTRLTQPRLLFDWGYATIDADINWVEADQMWHMMIKKEGGKPGLFTATAPALTGPWGEPVEDDYVNFEGNKKCEGVSAFQLAGHDDWMIGYIEYSSKPKNYRLCIADQNMRNFHSPRNIEGVDRPQHGSFLRLTKDEYERLQAWSDNYELTKNPQPLTKAILNGVPWYDQHGKTVSAHGANIIKDGDKYYLFGEYKTDSANVFTGFSCYSSDDLCNWQFERIAFSQQKDGRMGPERVGERPKVLKCPATGEYVMLMHSDNLRYKDPCVCYATSKTVNGEYTFQGPLLYKGQPIRRWDIGSFMDDDGQGYLLVHHGYIYRLAPDFHSADSCLMSGLKGTGESPAMFKKDGIYYWLSSHTTSWERNDNMYFTSKSLSGPWNDGGEFAPKGSLTWNSQCSFVLVLPDGTPMYMGDRWSFPRQQSSATYVWLPMQANGNDLMIPDYWETWNPASVSRLNLATQHIADGWTGEKPGDTYTQKISGGQRIAIYGTTDSQSGYAEISIKDNKGREIFTTSIDFYSKTPATGLRWVSPQFPQGDYTLEVRVSDMKPNWTDKTKTQYGSTGYQVKITEIVYI